MKYTLTGLAAAVALAAVALTPETADAGWRGGYWGGGWGPGFGIYVGPRPYYRNYGYGYGYRPYYNPYYNHDHYSYGYGPPLASPLVLSPAKPPPGGVKPAGRGPAPEPLT
jgi:hypothetical protein